MACNVCRGNSENRAFIARRMLSRHQKVSLLTALYLAQGLPFGFFTLALPVVLREAGYSLTAISALNFLYLPWALKFLWAPVLDRVGSRRVWLLTLQISSIAAALLLASLDLERSLAPVLAAAFVFNIIAASQDVITDGLAVRILDSRERGAGNGVQVGAYRIGMILGGGLLLWVFAKSNWSVMFTCMAVLLSLTVIPVLWLREPELGERRELPTIGYLTAGWIKRLMMPGTLAMVGLILCYRFGDQMVSLLLGPFLNDYGLSKETIAFMKGTVGSSTSLVGALLGGWFAFFVGRRQALLTSGVAQAACFLLYILASADIGGIAMLWWATILEGVIGTMATVALFTLMMDASDPEHAGTDYTLLASVVVLVGALSNVVAALIADRLGYTASFAIGAVLAVLGCLAVVWVLDRYPLSERIARAWRRG
jgi:MFS family permease